MASYLTVALAVLQLISPDFLFLLSLLLKLKKTLLARSGNAKCCVLSRALSSQRFSLSSRRFCFFHAFLETPGGGGGSFGFRCGLAVLGSASLLFGSAAETSEIPSRVIIICTQRMTNTTRRRKQPRIFTLVWSAVQALANSRIPNCHSLCIMSAEQLHHMILSAAIRTLPRVRALTQPPKWKRRYF